MNELVAIDAHNFDREKSKLKKLLDTGVSTTVNLPTVETDAGPFGWFDHSVTGAELNDLTASIGKKLIATNSAVIGVLDELRQVYNTFNALDKDYIQGINLSLRANSETSRRALDIAKKTETIANETSKNTADIENMVKFQGQTISVLERFKSQIDRLKHINDIDSVWNDFQMLDKTLKRLEAKQAGADNRIETLGNFVSVLEKSQHITEIDTLWRDCENAGKDLRTIKDEAAEQLRAAESRLTDELRTIDAAVATCKESLSVVEERAAVQTQAIDLLKATYGNQADTFAALQTSKANVDEVAAYAQKLRFAFILAGGSMFVSFLIVILNIIGAL